MVEWLHALHWLILFCVVLQTELCGWGVVASESINKGDFIIEYIGEGDSLTSEAVNSQIRCSCFYISIKT